MLNMDGRNADPLTVDVGLSTEREEMMSVHLFICLFFVDFVTLLARGFFRAKLFESIKHNFKKQKLSPAVV